MNEKKQKLILDGNAFYEIDLECLKQKKKKSTEKNKGLSIRKGRGNNLCLKKTR